MGKAWLVVLAVLALSACASGPPRTPAVTAASCSVSDADRAWIERALAAWRYSEREITGIGHVRSFQAVFFDHACVLTSANALTSTQAAQVTWSAISHSGEIHLPDGGAMPAGVTSFTHADAAGAYFVMSTPSVWRAGGVDNPALGLETMMVAVLLHEGSHIAQSSTYGARVEALAARNHLGDDFDDDSLQRHFGDNQAFATSVARETDLFFEAAAAGDDAAVRRLAREARAMMKVRAAQFYVGDAAYWAEAEDLWLTFEGAGQWAGYTWLIDPHGGGVSRDVAMPNFARRARWWSQNEGLGIVLVLDRLTGHAWRAHAFGDGAQSALQMLDAALTAGAPG